MAKKDEKRLQIRGVSEDAKAFNYDARVAR